MQYYTIIQAWRYGVQALILTVAFPIVLTIGFAFFPLFSVFGWWAIPCIPIAVAVSYAACYLFERVDEYADGMIDG